MDKVLDITLRIDFIQSTFSEYPDIVLLVFEYLYNDIIGDMGGFAWRIRKVTKRVAIIATCARVCGEPNKAILLLKGLIDIFRSEPIGYC